MKFVGWFSSSSPEDTMIQWKVLNLDSEVMNVSSLTFTLHILRLVTPSH